MDSFIQKHEDSVTGVLSGFDRLLIRGGIRSLAYAEGARKYLWRMCLMLEDFATHAEKLTRRLKESAHEMAERTGRPITYLESSKIDKEDLARQIAIRDGILSGLVVILTCIEPCLSFEVYRNRDEKRLELKRRRRKCLHHYFYMIHPEFGWMNARVQTWFPFDIHLNLNGREWLARQMEAAGLKYERFDNTFTWVQDVQKAQELFSKQLEVDWPEKLSELASQLNPLGADWLPTHRYPYYWTVQQSEWATDVMFKDQATLSALFPTLVHHGVAHIGSPDVMSFLGHKLTRDGNVHGNFTGKIISSMKQRAEGTRLKHFVNSNSVKMYTKWNVLRVETTINNPSEFTVYRKKEGDDEGTEKWHPLRKGVADLHRRAHHSQKVNERYLAVMSTASDKTPLKNVTASVSRPTKYHGKRVRALSLWSEQDTALLTAIHRGEFTINGFRNRDLRGLLFNDEPADPKQRRRQMAKVTRMVRMLRAHGVVRKVPRTHRYLVTDYGRVLATATLAAQNADTETLMKQAA